MPQIYASNGNGRHRESAKLQHLHEFALVKVMQRDKVALYLSLSRDVLSVRFQREAYVFTFRRIMVCCQLDLIGFINNQFFCSIGINDHTIKPKISNILRYIVSSVIEIIIYLIQLAASDALFFRVFQNTIPCSIHFLIKQVKVSAVI